MKIGILTTPLFYNFGGILQCYALKTTLQENGYDVKVIDIQYAKQNIISILKNIVKGLIKRFFLKDKEAIIYNATWSRRGRDIISQNVKPFVEKNIKERTAKLNGVKKLHVSKELIDEFDAIVVGSDQVWRPLFSDVYTYFLGFIESKHIRKVAYAASLGVDNWEFSESQTEMAKQLVKDFHVVSVREKSGIDLCERFLNIEAIHVLDPTLLLEKHYYEKLVGLDFDSVRQYKERNELMIYMLDYNEEKENLVNFIAYKENLTPYFSNNINTEKNNLPAKKRIVPSVESWIEGFMKSKFVVTDSFHGTVFSIIFNKPFIVYANTQRGGSRFISLLEMFNLEDRLVTSLTDLKNKTLKPIDWNEVNSIVDNEKSKSIAFLKNSLA